MSTKQCRECNKDFDAKRDHAAFCCTECRKAWNNRRATRGAQMYDAVMAMRYDRKAAAAAGIDWTFVCRMAELFNRDDQAGRGPQGGPSFQDPAELKAAMGALVNARIVGYDGTGRRRA